MVRTFDNPEFYVELEERISEVGFENLFIGGGWNLVLDFTLDYYNYKHLSDTKAQEQVDTLMINFDLLDIWRELNPEKRQYTWCRNTPLQQSRLDFFLHFRLIVHLINRCRHRGRISNRSFHDYNYFDIWEIGV